MSLVEDQMHAANAACKEDNRLAEMDHRIEMAKKMLLSVVPKDSLVEEFKKNRVAIAMQTRWWKPSIDQTLPKKTTSSRWKAQQKKHKPTVSAKA